MIDLFRGHKAPGKRKQNVLSVLPSNLGKRGLFLEPFVLDGHTLAFLWLHLCQWGKESKGSREYVHLEPMWPLSHHALGILNPRILCWSCFQAQFLFSGSFNVNTPRLSTYWLWCSHMCVRSLSRCMMEPEVEEKEGGPVTRLQCLQLGHWYT